MAKAKQVEDGMFLAAARALADYVPLERIKNGTVYPELEGLRKISAVVRSISYFPFQSTCIGSIRVMARWWLINGLHVCKLLQSSMQYL